MPPCCKIRSNFCAICLLYCDGEPNPYRCGTSSQCAGADLCDIYHEIPGDVTLTHVIPGDCEDCKEGDRLAVGDDAKFYCAEGSLVSELPVVEVVELPT